MKIPNSENSILVPIAFDETMDGVLAIASKLALQTGANLSLFHVIKALGISSELHQSNEGSLHIIEDEMSRVAENGLRLALERLPKGISATTSYAVAKSKSAAIIEKAEKEHSSLILCGVKDVDHGFWSRTSSTALGLLADSPISVLFIPKGSVFLNNKDRLNILVADDLRDSGLAAFRMGLYWAHAFEQSHLTHVYVNPMTQDAFVSSYLASTTSFYEPMVIPIDPVELYEQTNKLMQTKLDDRILSVEHAGNLSKDRYVKLMACGDVSHEIGKIADEALIDIIIFGRHQLIHTKPISLGEVSYKHMLSIDRPFMVVPLLG